jgi:hypothetical protein
VYVVVATADAPNNGSVSPPSIASTPLTPPATASASFAPLATSTGFAEGNNGDTVGQLQAGDTFTVNFNGPVSVTTPFSLNVTDGVDSAVLNQTNSTLTQSSSTSVIYTVTNNSIPGTPSLLQFSTTQPLEVTGQSGVSNSVGPWNLAGGTAVSAAATTTPSPYLGVFDAVNNSLVTTAVGGAATPVMGAIASPTGQTTVPIAAGGCTTGDTVTVYTENGAALGSATCAGGTVAGGITVSQTVLSSTPLLANQTAGGVAYVSQTAYLVGINPVPIAAATTLTTPGTNVDVTVSQLPNLVVGLSFAQGSAVTGSNVHVGVTPVTTAAAFTVASNGQIVAIYTSGTGPAPQTLADTDTITATDLVGGGTSASDTYVY